MSALLIFDCDGVLVDSELLEHAVDAGLLVLFGCRAGAAQLLQCFVGITRRDMYEAVFGELKRAVPAGLLADAPKCVASSSLPDKLRMKLETTGLAHHFAPHIFSTALVAGYR
jgi:beta-phosphoglucomutase-like phosphatase (HAD superfamily)